MSDLKTAREMSREDVMSIASVESHTVLYHCCMAYRQGDCTWEEAMQVAAIMLSRIESQLRADLIKLHLILPKKYSNGGE